MSFRRFILLLALLAAPAAARQTIGAFATWAAFCDEPRKCFAITMPVERRGDPFLMIEVAGSTLMVRTHAGRPLRRASVRIGAQSFQLTVQGTDGAADKATSRRIIRAMREGEALTVIAIGMGGGKIRHHYALAGAPSAIDAAAIAARP